LALLSDSEEENLVLAVSPPPLRQYSVWQVVHVTVRPDLRLYTTTNNVGNYCTCPGIILALDKENQKEVLFDKALKKTPSQGINAPFGFNILAQLANILARITLHELLRLSKEMR